LSRIMRGGVAETVSGGLANVVGGVCSIVNYVNPLAMGARATQERSAVPDSDANSEAPGGDAHSEAPGGSTPGSGHGDSTPSSASGGDAKAGSSPPLLLQPASAGTSVAADLDERCLADANADNPENNRPPTPTKTSFTRMLRLPAHTVGDPSLLGSSAEYKQAVRNDPVSRNVAQRTGRQFRPGAEEKRHYMRRMSKAPQLIAQAPDEQDDSDDATAVPVRATTSNQQRLRSLSLGSSRLSSTQNDAREDDSDASADGQPVDDGEADAGELARLYHDAAATQRSAAKTHAVEPWRFISPRVKRVKRRVLWRLFLAQELTPAVYDEASVFRAASATSSP
ncbi:hypothetical protein IWQ56_006404, partial [Coemansia nantahalensis]